MSSERVQCYASQYLHEVRSVLGFKKKYKCTLLVGAIIAFLTLFLLNLFRLALSLPSPCI